MSGGCRCGSRRRQQRARLGRLRLKHRALSMISKTACKAEPSLRVAYDLPEPGPALHGEGGGERKREMDGWIDGGRESGMYRIYSSCMSAPAQAATWGVGARQQVVERERENAAQHNESLPHFWQATLACTCRHSLVCAEHHAWHQGSGADARRARGVGGCVAPRRAAASRQRCPP